MTPQTNSPARTILTSTCRFVTLGQDNINGPASDSDAFLFWNTVTPTPP